MDLLHAVGIHVVHKSNIHQQFAVFDQKIVWNGSINLLSFGRAEESIMRLENPNIADELLGMHPELNLFSFISMVSII